MPRLFMNKLHCTAHSRTLALLRITPLSIFGRSSQTRIATMASSSNHPPFKETEASRPEWDRNTTKVKPTRTVNPDWQPGDGANQLEASTGTGPSTKFVCIDPNDPARESRLNYKTVISGIVPRPIALISSYMPAGGEGTGGGDRDSAQKDTYNLAPFSYFNVINHDPPLFTVGFSSPLTKGAVRKDTLANLAAAQECVVHIISEHFLEAANATCIDAPRGVDEWVLAGLTPAWDCEVVRRAPRIRESIFAIECKVAMLREFESRRDPGKATCTLAVLEGVRFWVRDDALGKDMCTIDTDILRPVARLGGISYSRVLHFTELPRLDWEKDFGGQKAYDAAAQRVKERQEKAAQETREKHDDKK